MNREELNRISYLVETLDTIDIFLSLTVPKFELSFHGCIVENKLSVPNHYISIGLIEYQKDL
jgi:hypothetical protein